MNVHVRALCGVALLLTPLGTMRAQSMDLAVISDRVFAAWNNTHGPGCAVGIARGGRTVFARGYGMADIASERPITPKTILESGSVAKQFTAMSVLLLMQDGKLSLEDDARKYIPELPTYGRTITVRNLLTHTSGLREWSNLVLWQGWPRGTRVHTQSDVFELITHQKVLNYPVGDYYSYTNSGFLLLRTIVERVSGMSLPRFTAERIFTPLGMTQTQWRDDFTKLVPGLAQAYARRPDGWHLDMPFDNIIGAGGLLTTVGDWLLWNEALTKKTLGAAVSDSMTRQMKLTSGQEIQYAMGLTVARYRGIREIGHSGSTAGYSTFLARYPDQDNLSIAVMCNAAGAAATAYTHAMVDAMVPSLARAAAPDTVAPDAAAIAKLRGIYRDTRTNTTLQLAVVNGQLQRVGAGVLRPLRDGAYLAGASRLRFSLGQDGRPIDLRQPTADGDTLVFKYMAESVWTPTAAELASILGTYRNDEIGATFTVVALGDNRIVVSPRLGLADTLTAIARDVFVTGGGNTWFSRDAKGKVAAMHISSARVWDFVSPRVK